MLPLFFNCLFLLLILVFIFGIVFSDFVPKKTLMYILSSSLILLFLIPLIGHSNLLLNYQLRNQLDKISIDKVNFRSDKKAIEEINSLNHPIRFKILSKTKKEDNMYDFIIKTEENKQRYLIRMINYTEPLKWIPFNDFQINQVNKVK